MVSADLGDEVSCTARPLGWCWPSPHPLVYPTAPASEVSRRILCTVLVGNRRRYLRERVFAEGRKRYESGWWGETACHASDSLEWVAVESRGRFAANAEGWQRFWEDKR